MPTDNSSLAASVNPSDLEPVGLFNRIDELTEKMLAMPQAPMPVIHRFAPGLYIREVHMQKGSFVIGHVHRTEHFNVMLQGHLIMVNEDGTTTEYIAPQSYVAEPGRKVAYIVEDVVWQNIFPATETDIDALEERLLIKSEKCLLNEKMVAASKRVEHEADRFSYREMLSNFDLTEKQVRAISENEADQIDMPYPVHPYRLAKSPIEGKGYFLTVPAKAGAILAPSRIGDKRTPAGRYVNHSGTPNAMMKEGPDGTLYLVAIKDINGCMGGDVGEEVTTDYAHTLNLLASKISSGEKLCQQEYQQ